ncbi:PepSY domain-containing protein [uncultured Paraglaciecola sp.]|uniref:PepSY domain-containing protein n=1 Tax=uncultured Paraglaciecola sp. TaxID=1765024 RepID=UPI00260498CB|nr:PepSY domain-containing protein [uncultured Paraglaciecola sp.]
MNRLQLMKIHSLLAAFIFPVAIMFMVTGSLYTWGIKGSYFVETFDIPLEQAIQPELTELTVLAEEELHKLGLSVPSGQAKIKTMGSQFTLEWTGSDKDISLAPTDNTLVAQLTVKKTSWYRNLVQLHKAKGGVIFKVYAVVFAISMLLLLFSGFMMAWQTPKLKRITSITFVAGIGSFFVFVYLS